LEQLKQFDALATFFCIGDNVRKHPGVYQEILTEGHATGNHSFNHLNGWRTPTSRYVENVLLAQAEMEKFKGAGTTSKLFRPPYGRIREKQVKVLQKSDFKVVM